MPFSYETKVQLHHTDAAGVLFYSKLFELMFDAFDDLLDSIGASVVYIIHESDFLLPFVYAEADFLCPVFVDDKLRINISVKNLGDSSVTLSYDVRRGEDQVAAAQTVHVAMDKSTLKKRTLPEVIRKGLLNFVSGA